LIDNSDPEGAKLIASGAKNQADDIANPETWSELMERFQ
jgi:hypothetical protein